MKYVLTETSAYIVDETAKYVVRLPGLGAGSVEGITAATVSELRLDGTEIPLLHMVQLEVGNPMKMILDVRGDGVHTLRETTIVRSIEEVEPAAAG